MGRKRPCPALRAFHPSGFQKHPGSVRRAVDGRSRLLANFTLVILDLKAGAGDDKWQMAKWEMTDLTAEYAENAESGRVSSAQPKQRRFAAKRRKSRKTAG